MSVYSPLANEIAGWLVVAAMMALGGYRAFWTAWVVRTTAPIARKHITQVTRFRMIGLGWLCTVPTIVTLIKFGPVDIVRTLALLIDADPVFGGAIAITAILGTVGIVFALLASYSVFMNPSKFWKRTRTGQYILTADVYRGRTRVPVKWIRFSEHDMRA